MSRTLALTAMVIREGEQFVALCPELDISSFGESREDARRMLQEAIEGFLLVADDEEVDYRLANPVGFTEAFPISRG
ncbi:MAG: type II toxin-antitoxin system HicB family antitoxin [bacterium]